MMRGLVSTIIPVFNRASMMREAVDSVLRQTYRPVDIIIVDDGSTDETGMVANDLVLRYPKHIQVIHQTNTGPGGARETGRVAATGEFIQYLDSDDLLLPHKFELQVAGLKANSNCGVSYGKTRHYRRGSEPQDIPWRKTGQKIEFMFPSFLESRVWSTVTPLYRREVTDRGGPWTRLRQEEDWEYDCRIASLGVRLHYCNDFIAEQRMHDSSSLSDAWVTDRTALQDRVHALQLIYSHARRSGMDHTTPEMQHFARGLFLLCRQYGAVGFANESRQLFELAGAASGPVWSERWDFRLYAYLARFIGFSRLGNLSCMLDRFRRNRISRK